LAERKKAAMITKETNKILVHNILPLHVADLYLSRQFRNEIYSEEYENVAVMFATIMNFETSPMNSTTMESDNTDLVKLNQIICAFDETLMQFSRNLKIEKIKVAGWSYMCACGLDPGRGVESQNNSLANRRSLMGLSTSNLTPRSRKVASIVKCTSPQHRRNIVMNLVNFALELMRVLKRLDESNENFKHNPGLQLRVGISHGHVMAGVIGLTKPLYDIWGNSVSQRFV
jgi:adenylate cyclase